MALLFLIGLISEAHNIQNIAILMPDKSMTKWLYYQINIGYEP